jgi:hypothetical protein
VANVIIPNNVTNIGDWAFSDCASLTGVTLLNSATSIGDYAFNGCNRLTTMTLGESVTSIGLAAFFGCYNLASANIPDSVTNIGIEAFYGCESMTNLTIPSSVTSIGEEAFQNCLNLTSAYFLGNSPPDNGTVFVNDPATVYYLPGTTGWSTIFGGVPTALWFLPNPLILNNNASFGVQTNRFGFTISWATNISVVVEVCTNLANPVWQPIQTNTLTGGASYFSDPQWENYRSRFYRVRSP